MAADTNYLTTSTLTDFLRTLYSADLMAVARPMLYYQQFCEVKREPGTQHAKQVYWTKVHDAPTYIGTLTENDGTVPSGVLDDDQVSVTVYEHGFVFKTTEYLEVTQYLNNGNLSGLIREKIGVHMGRRQMRHAHVKSPLNIGNAYSFLSQGHPRQAAQACSRRD